ncbi:uncharacterized protein LOC133742634 [Rosa rugosa]|uniref:uncharacterized protein LOC133742634 n=1 Tax=Rosa rugosa TaxID=74645 RepID=UPI002B406D6B|nr:uncharacterized protein LOC133742634 [Rosa rugosa]
MESLTHMTCGLKLDLSSNGWYKYLTKLLKNIAGVSYQIDAQAGMAYISGKVNAKKLLERIVKAGEKDAAVCWVRTGEEYTTPCYGNGYYNDQQRLLSCDPYNNYNYMGSYAPTTPPPLPPSYYPSYGHHNPMTHYYPQLPPPYTSYY